MEATVADNPDERRYEIHTGGERAGFVEYHLHAGEIAFLHTEIDSRFEGQGLASKLARYVLDDARERSRTVLPYCPFIRGWISKHPDYVSLVPEDQRARFEL